MGRFSLLTLAYGERYLEDRAVLLEATPPLTTRPVTGRLKVASWSLTLDPDDQEAPVLRVMLRECERPPEARGETVAGFTLAPRVVLHKRDMHAPFVSHVQPEGAPPLRFTLLHAPLPPLLALTAALHEALYLPEAEAEARICSATAGGGGFDLTSLVDPLEARELQPAGNNQASQPHRSLVGEIAVTRVWPMTHAPALLLLTRSRLYLQSPAEGSSGGGVTHWLLSQLRCVVRRRHRMRHLALEMQFDETEWGTAEAGSPAVPGRSASGSVLLAFPCRDSRERFLASLCSARAALGLPALPPPPESRLTEMRVRWQHGLLSTFDYLLFLNDCAGRSSLDLSQHPVFPWVISDYSSPTLDLADPAVYRDLSRPIGALDEARLRLFRERYASMPPGEAFMFGTHFSAPAFVAFFLLRSAPELTLHLHGGKYDDPDRLFCSMKEAWVSCLRSTSDVKELIPQFYDPTLHNPPSASFLVNSRGLPLGRRSSGAPVGDVQLPPWADSPVHFVTTCRAALEGAVGSARVHLWIDLIFGHKQRGAAAAEADHVFCKQAYEGAIDLDALTETERRVVDLQVQEFGQMPAQLFTRPHPPRRPSAHAGALLSEDELCNAVAAAEAAEWGVGAKTQQLQPFSPGEGCGPVGGSSLLPSLRLRHRARLQPGPVSSVFLAEDGTTACATGGTALRVYCSIRGRSLRTAASVAGGADVSSCVQLPGLDLVCVGGWDGSLRLYSVGRACVTASVPHAHAAGISFLCIGPAGLLSGGWDGVLRLWRPSYHSLTPVWRSAVSASAVSCAALHPDHPALAAAGARDGSVSVYDVSTGGGGAAVRSWRHAGGGEVSAVSLGGAPGAPVVVSACLGVSILVGDATGRAPPVPLCRAGTPQFAVCASGDHAVSAGEGGAVHVWELRRARLVATLRAGEGGAVRSAHLVVGEGGAQLLLGLSDGSVELWGAEVGRPRGAEAGCPLGERVESGRESGAGGRATWGP
jgi:factor associated with neutral sphingomyelinase activation